MNPYTVNYDSPDVLCLAPLIDFEVNNGRVVCRNGTELPPICVVSGRTWDLERESRDGFVLQGVKADSTVISTLPLTGVALCWCFYFDAPEYLRLPSPVCFVTILVTFLVGSCLLLRRLGTTITASWYVNRQSREQLLNQHRTTQRRRLILWMACLLILGLALVLCHQTWALRYSWLKIFLMWTLLMVGGSGGLLFQPFGQTLRLLRWEGEYCEFVVRETCQSKKSSEPPRRILEFTQTDQIWLVSH